MLYETKHIVETKQTPWYVFSMTVTVVKQQEHQTQQQKNQYINQKPSLELTTVLTNQYFHFYK